MKSIQPSTRGLAFILAVSVLLLPGAVTAARDHSQDPLPEFYGFYALEGGKLREFYQNQDLNDFGPAVRFVVFSKSIASGIPVRKIFLIPPPKPIKADDGQFKGWEDFMRQANSSFDTDMKRIEFGVGADAIEVPFRVGPYGGSAEMVRVVPTGELRPGLYQLVQGIRFWVRRSEVAKLYETPVVTAVAPETVRSEPSTTATPKTTRPVTTSPFSYEFSPGGNRIAVPLQDSVLKYVCCGGKKVLELAGSRANLRFQPATVQFVVDSSFYWKMTGTFIKDDCRMYPAEVKEGKRVAEVRKGKGVPCIAEPFGSEKALTKITVGTPLAPGEYIVGPVNPEVPSEGGIAPIVAFGVDGTLPAIATSKKRHPQPQ